MKDIRMLSLVAASVSLTLSFAGCYKGTQSFFALMSGPVPHGNKLLIQSGVYLYCVGEK